MRHTRSRYGRGSNGENGNSSEVSSTKQQTSALPDNGGHLERVVEVALHWNNGLR